MNRAAFLKRMAFAALASGFMDSWVPGVGAVESDDEFVARMVDSGMPIPPGEYNLTRTIEVPLGRSIIATRCRFRLPVEAGPVVSFLGHAEGSTLSYCILDRRP